MKIFFILLTFCIEWNTNSAQEQQIEKTPSPFQIGRKHQPISSDAENSIYFNGKKNVLQDSDLAVLQSIIPNQEWKLAENKFQRAAKAAETRKMLSIDISSLGRNGIKLSNTGGRKPILMDIDVSVLSKGPDNSFPISKSVSHMTEMLKSPYDRLPVPVQGHLLNPHDVVLKPNTERNEVAVFHLPIKPLNSYNALIPETKKGDRDWQPFSVLMKLRYPPFFYFPVIQRNTQKMLEIPAPKYVIPQAEIINMANRQREYDKMYSTDDLDHDHHWQKDDFQAYDESSEEAAEI